MPLIAREVISDREDYCLEELFRAHAPRLARICRTYLANSADAEDAMQETFARCAERLGVIETDPAAYLAATARNVCKDMLRRRKTVEKFVSLHHQEPSDHPGHVTVERTHLRLVWKSLSRTDQKLLALRFVGFSYGEIAEAVQGSVKGVSVGIARARQRARAVGAGLSATIVLGWLLRRMKRPLTPAMATVAFTIVSLGLSINPPDGQGGSGGAHSSTPSVAAARPLSTVDSKALGSNAGPGAIQAAARTVDPGRLVPNNADPHSAMITSIVASPSFASDHTLWASGTEGLCTAVCSVLFESRDAGKTWTLLAPQAWVGGDLLVAATGTPTLVSFSPTLGLETSTDGGRSFQALFPGARISADAQGARVATFGPDRRSILAVDLAGRKATVAAISSPLDTPTDLMWDGTTNGVLVAASAIDPVSGKSLGRIYRCTANGCDVIGTLPSVGAIRFVKDPLSPDLLARDGSTVFRSLDRGVSWTKVVGMTGTISWAGMIGTGARAALVVSAWSIDKEGRLHSSTIQTNNWGRTTSQFGGASLNGQNVVNALIGVDHLTLAGLEAGVGVICSRDSVRWSYTC